MTKRINLISSPRNISTALMYSFANRKDTRVVDEPMYAFYLHETGIQYHPCTEEILADLPTSLKDVLEQIFFKEMEEEVYFIKGMAHHYVQQELSFLLQLQNVFLVRNPYQLIASFAQVVKEPTMRDIGIKRAWEIAQFLNDDTACFRATRSIHKIF